MSMFDVPTSQPAGGKLAPARAPQHQLARPGVTHPGPLGPVGASGTRVTLPVPEASPAPADARSAFKRAQAARAAAEAELRPPRTVTLPASAWAQSYPNRPGVDVELGLRLYSEAEAVQARSRAAQLAWRRHPQDSDVEERVAAGDGALMAYLVARCATQPDDASRPYFGAELGGSEEIVELALTPKGIELLFHGLNQLLLEESPIVPEADDEDLAWLAGELEVGEAWKDMDEGRARRARRLFAAAIELLGGNLGGGEEG